MANPRCVQTPPVQPLPAEPAGDVTVLSVPAETTGPSCAEQPLLGWAPRFQSSCYQFRLVPHAVETWPVRNTLP